MAQQLVTDIGAVPIGGMVAVDVEGRRIAVANVDGTLFAFGDTCTHRGCSLAKGHLSGTTVTCSCHGSQFDVTTGRVLKGPAVQPVQTYPVKLQGGHVQVEI
jgi:3-phenylpropionate/trans-cinnamate dioxygenase ferredoxin subunit